MKKKVYYVYIDFTEEIIPRPYYVGKGLIKRINNFSYRNKLYENIAKKLGQKREIVYETLIEQDAKEKEIELIEIHKTYFYGGENYWGCNFTKGGDGTSGHKGVSSDTQKKAVSLANTGKLASDETKMKMKISMKERRNNPAWIEKMKNVSEERWKNPAYREKVIQSNTGKKRSGEALQNIVHAAKKRANDPEIRENQSKSAKKRFESNEEKEKVSKSVKALWGDPEYKKRQSEAIKNGHLRKKMEKLKNKEEIEKNEQ